MLRRVRGQHILRRVPAALRVLHLRAGLVEGLDEVDAVAPHLLVHALVESLRLHEHAEAAGRLQLRLALIDAILVELHVLRALIAQIEDDAPLMLRLRRLADVGGRLPEDFPVRRLIVAGDDLRKRLRPAAVSRLDADGEATANGSDQPVDRRDVFSGLLEHMHDVVALEQLLESLRHEHRVLVGVEHMRRPVVLASRSREDPVERLRRLVAALHRLGPGVPCEEVLRQEHVSVPPPIQLRGVLGVVQDIRRPSLVLVHCVDPSPVQRAG